MTKLFDSYFTYVEKTEPPLLFHRWCFLASVGALLGRQFRLPFGDFHIYPNQYVMLIGDPGTRKSTAIKLAAKIITAVGYDKFAAERTSKEKFLLDLEGLETDDANSVNSLFTELDSTVPREVFITADEFNEFVGSGNLEFLSLLGSLWDWDKPESPFKQRLKTSRSVNIYQPTISILAGNTHAGFSEAFPPQALGQGFMSRLLLVHGEASGKKIAFPEKPPDSVKLELVSTLREMQLKVSGDATMTSKAESMLQTIYNSFQGLEDARFKHYSTRRYTHLLKLCLIITALNLRTEIRMEDVLVANTILTYTEHKMPSAMGEFGKAKNADVASRIISVLSEAREPLDLSAIWKQVQSDLDRPDDLNKLLQGLLQGGKIQYVPRTATRQTQGYLIVRKMLSSRNVYVDYALLREAQPT